MLIPIAPLRITDTVRAERGQCFFADTETVEAPKKLLHCTEASSQSLSLRIAAVNPQPSEKEQLGHRTQNVGDRCISSVVFPPPPG